MTDRAWEPVASLLPEKGGRGRQRRDRRTVVYGIPRKPRTGALGAT